MRILVAQCDPSATVQTKVRAILYRQMNLRVDAEVVAGLELLPADFTRVRSRLLMIALVASVGIPAEEIPATFVAFIARATVHMHVFA